MRWYLSPWQQRLLLAWLTAILLGQIACRICAAEPNTLTLDSPGLAEVLLPYAGDDYDVSFTVEERGKSDWLIYDLGSGTVFVTYVADGEEWRLRSQVITWADRSVEVQSHVIKIGSPEPSVPGPPVNVDRPIGDAGDIYDAATRLRQPQEAQALAEAFQRAIATIEADSKMTSEAATGELTKQIDAAGVDPKRWQSFFDLISDYVKRHAKSRSTSLQTLRTIERGLDAAARQGG